MPHRCLKLMVIPATIAIIQAINFVVLLSIGWRAYFPIFTLTTNGKWRWGTVYKKLGTYLAFTPHGQSVMCHTGGCRSWRSAWTHYTYGMCLFTTPSSTERTRKYTETTDTSEGVYKARLGLRKSGKNVQEFHRWRDGENSSKGENIFSIFGSSYLIHW